MRSARQALFAVVVPPHFAGFAVVACLVCVVSACAANSESVKAFFAPDFHTADDTQLQDGMWRLGRGVQDLDDTFTAAGENVSAEHHARILETLDIMSAAAASVKAPGARQGHTNVAMNIDKLVVDIDNAKAAVAVKDYTLARALPVSCLACHEGVGGGPQKK
jgi:hypothetical protein